MTPKIYLRSPRPDGYWEGVEPAQREPKQSDYTEYIGTDSDGKDRYVPDYLEYGDAERYWKRHLASLPVLYLIHPDLAKVGWVMEYGEQYWIRHGDRWSISDKDEYDSLPNDQRRIILVPVEGKAERYEVFESNNDCPGRWKAATKQQYDACTFEPHRRIISSDKAEEKEVVSDPFVDKKCVQCGKEFRGLPDGSYCSITCWDAHCLHGVPNIEQPATTKEQHEKAQEGEVTVQRPWEAAIDYCNQNHVQTPKDVFKRCFNSFIAGVNWKHENEFATPQPVTGEDIQEMAKEAAKEYFIDLYGESWEMEYNSQQTERKLLEKMFLAGAASRSSDAVDESIEKINKKGL